jgi:methylated-DNA-[protein]-cysteine S-methyltransferase
LANTGEDRLKTYYDCIESPIGTLTLLSNGTELTGLYMDRVTGRRGDGETGTGNREELESASNGWIDPDWIQDPKAAPIVEVAKQLKAYFAGEQKEFDVPLSLAGTEFQQRVWEELCRIPYGVTISYGELATRVGNPQGSRAVGLANGRNPISIIVPCHRVIGANGKLVGYGGGLDRKFWLLEHEQGSRGLGF